MMSMKALVEASGVHRQTVHSYLREGLLPPAVEGAGTRSARYGPAHLALLALIRELRDTRGMSLIAIRRCFERAGFDPDEVRRTLDGQAAPRGAFLVASDQGLLDRDALLAGANASESVLAILERAGLIPPQQDDPRSRFHRTAVPILAAANRLLEDGTAEDTVVHVARLGQGIADLEAVALVAEAAQSDGKLPAARAEARHQRITELVGAIRLSTVQHVVERLAEFGPKTRTFADDAIYVPTPLFIQRYGLDAVLEQAEAAATVEARGGLAALRHGRLLLGLGRYEEAEIWLSRSAQRDPENAETFAYLGVCQAVPGRAASGVEACRRAVELAPQSPRAHAFLGAALALLGATSAGLLGNTDVLLQALEIAAKSRTLDAVDIREQMEVLLARGRLFSVLPGDDEGRADLEQVLARTEDSTDEDNGFEFPGTNAVYRTHALFFLGCSASQDGAHARARRLLDECITIDPASRFAARAYDLLSQTR